MVPLFVLWKSIFIIQFSHPFFFGSTFLPQSYRTRKRPSFRAPLGQIGHNPHVHPSSFSEAFSWRALNPLALHSFAHLRLGNSIDGGSVYWFRNFFILCEFYADVLVELLVTTLHSEKILCKQSVYVSSNLQRNWACLIW